MAQFGSNRGDARRRTGRWCALAAAVCLCAGHAHGEGARAPRRFLIEGPIGTVDLSRAPSASTETIPGAPRFMRPRAVIVTDAPLTDAQRDRLTTLGVTRIHPLEDGAYTIALPAGSAAQVEALDFVRAATWFRPEWKLDPGLDRRNFADPDRAALSARGMTRVQVSVFAESDAPEVLAVRDALAALPGAVVYATTEIGASAVISADVSRADLPSIASLPSVQYVEPAPEITFRNNTVRGIVQSGAPGNVPLHNAGLQGDGAIIGVCDSGLDTNHCAFTAAPGKIVAFNGAPAVTDHGTHVACTAAGDAVAAGDLRGHAYHALIAFSRTPAFTFTDLFDTLSLQSSEGAFVHTNSWGDDNTTLYTGLCRSIDDFMFTDEDQLVVFAATNQTFLRTPENAKNALSVAAVNDTPNIDTFCSGGQGLTADGRLKPDVLAPGCSINSADGGTACSVRSFSGTSMAAPAVAGTAVLVRQYFTDGFYPSGAAVPSDAFTPSGALVKAMLVNSATGAGGVPNLPANQSSFRAWGRILADDSVYLAGDARHLVVRDVRNADGLATGSSIDVPVVVTGAAQRLKVTLTWTDPPPAPGIQTALVNNLDLSVISPGGASTYLGNVFTGGVSTTGGTADALNNVEQVWIDAPGVGAWTVRISGTSIPAGPQGFALVVTGEVDPQAVPLTVAAIDPPTEIAPGAATAPFTVRVDEGSDTLVPGTALLHYRYAGPSFSTVPLSDLGGNDFEAMLPRASCGHTPEFYVSAEGATTGEVDSPIAGATGPRSALVGASSIGVVFSEDFEGGIPGTWSATGLWHDTSMCSAFGGCTGTVWAYYGDDVGCTYDIGAATSGSLITPNVSLPAIGPGESLTLLYCAAMTNENASRYDRGLVRINGLELDETPNTNGDWTAREVDLSGYAGQTVQIEFYFNTFDSFSNSFTGWLLDAVAIEHATFACVDPCPGDINGSGSVNSSDFNILASHFGAGPNATRDEGDLTGDGYVNSADFNILAGAFGAACP